MAKSHPKWDTPYQNLTEGVFWSSVTPDPLVNPKWVDWNEDLAIKLQLSSNPIDAELLSAFSGGQPLNQWRPCAQVYSGHQFGQWAGQLGDGRGVCLGVSSSSLGNHEWHLKGVGRTPYSRSGDGRSVLRSAIREYLGSEYMHSLGIPTTRALAIVRSDTPVQRETRETGATLMRLARSHLRIGHFEHFYHRKAEVELRELIEFAIEQLDPDISELPDRIEIAFTRYVERSAALVAEWMAVGFVHGVMNTDNTALSGETLDYGPYGFLMQYDPAYVINHTDQTGRYAFGQQPRVMHWNLSCLAETLTPFVTVDRLREILSQFPDLYLRYYHKTMSRRLALQMENPKLISLIQNFKTIWGERGMFYPELFAFLLLDDWQGLNRPQELSSKAYQLKTDWKAEVDKSSRALARTLCPAWMLSHWLLDTVIEYSEGGDDSLVRGLRASIGSGLDNYSNVVAKHGSSPPDEQSAYHLSCSS